MKPTGPAALAAATGLTAAAVAVWWWQRHRASRKAGDEAALAPLPSWAAQFEDTTRFTRVRLREWEDPNWRRQHGFQGTDLCHRPEASGGGVQVLGYWVDEAAQRLVGIVRFGPRCESHAGLCHGGSMCALLDDLLGWCCFVFGDGPWTGCTAQVNCKLKRPVPLGAVLKCSAAVDKREDRPGGSEKATITGALTDGEDDSVVYALLEGVSVAGVDIGTGVAPKRVWRKADGEMVDVDP